MSEPEAGRREVSRVVSAIASTPWAITDDMLDTIVAIAMRQNEITPQALEAYRTRRVADAESLSVRQGVGIIRVAGPLFRYSDFFSAVSGASTYEGIREDLQRAADDPAVRSVLVTYDSPGGMVNGVAELAAAMRAFPKPLEAYVSNDASSAAYWLASAAQKITVADTAVLGSIGVKLSLKDTSEADAKKGVRTIEFVSSQSPHKTPDLNTDPGRAKVQKIVDDLAAVFVNAVSGYRGVSADDVIAKFGGGGIEIGARAVELGMADALGSFEATLERLSARQPAKLTMKGPHLMSDLVHTQAAFDDGARKARTEGETVGALAAQKRVKAILASDHAKDRRTLAEHLAFDTDMSADAAEKLLAISAKETVTVVGSAANGNRSKDAPGGLALADRTDRTELSTKADAPMINASKYYEKYNGV